jgi:cytochrome b6-f complex iron-sulfur subunit/menaquinol-cytochrome c reductase iron-sulfur subunit
VRIGRLADLPENGEPRRLQVIDDERDAFTVTRNQMLGSVWVLREGSGVRAMSATCPHLGCSIDINADKKSFACPCHASRFALSGAAEAGPSPRAMDPLAVRVTKDGWVEVDFRRFRQGTADREEVAG